MSGKTPSKKRNLISYTIAVALFLIGCFILYVNFDPRDDKAVTITEP